MWRRAGAAVLCALAIAMAGGSGALAAAYRTRHVIVAVMDGVRYSETFGDPGHRFVPRMWQELGPQGTLYTNFLNRGVTVTRQAHSSIASGTYQTVPNGGPRLTRPTFFDYFREETGAPADQAWAIFGKGAYSFAPYSSFPAFQARWAPRTNIGLGEGSEDDDRKVLAAALSVMKAHRPRLIFLNFGFTDHIGHKGTFDEYTRAVANVDGLFADLWTAVQADPEYRDSTTLILTNDHGRHDDAHGGFHSHGDGDEGCRHVFFLMLGPDTRAGTVIAEPAEQIDIAPTVGELLGFQTPLAQGRVLAESFRSFLGLNRKEARTPVEKAAVRTLELAGRDLGRAVAGHALSTLATLPSSPAAALLFHGLLSQAKDEPSAADPLAVQAARDWLERTRDAEGAAGLYRALVMLELPRAETAEVQRYLATLDPAAPGWTEVDRAFLLDLAARAGSAALVAPTLRSFTAAGGPGRTAGGAPGQPSETPHARALVLFALSDALASLSGPPQPARKQAALPLAGDSPELTRLREATLLRLYRAAQDQTEAGGLWPDPIDSLLYLSALERLDAAGLLRDFHAEKKLTRGKVQNEKAALPALVAGLSPATIAAWTKPGDQAAAKLPRRRMATLIWGLNRYLPYSRELSRYLVDEAGQAQGDDPVLANGAFLSSLVGAVR